MARQEKKVRGTSPGRRCAPPIHRSTDKGRKLARRRRSRAKRLRRVRMNGSPEWTYRYKAYALMEADDAQQTLECLVDANLGTQEQRERLKRKADTLSAQARALKS